MSLLWTFHTIVVCSQCLFLIILDLLAHPQEILFLV